MIEMFLSGEINYIVTEGWSLDIFSFNKYLAQTDIFCSEEQYEDIKLLSLFGRDDGSTSWKINRYRDGSGSWMEISAHKTFAAAQSRLLELILEKGVTKEHIALAAKHDITIPMYALEAFNEKEVTNIKSRIEAVQSELNTLNARLQEKLKV